LSGIDVTGGVTGCRVVTPRRVEEGCSAFERFPLGKCLPRVFSSHVLAGFHEGDIVGFVPVELGSVVFDLFDGV
jgi:hypothetical protein